MNKNERFLDPSESEIPQELVKLGRVIANLPEEIQQELEAPFCEVVDVVKRRRRILNLVQEALSQLRLDIKYLMFDLESTRKERDEAIQKLNEA
ncbi:MAG: transcriptional regulator [Planctomycetaceae bacterium]|nr:transcriptional regulator [Planctomycetaceae bacterium]